MYQFSGNMLIFAHKKYYKNLETFGVFFVCNLEQLLELRGTLVTNNPRTFMHLQNDKMHKADSESHF